MMVTEAVNYAAGLENLYEKMLAKLSNQPAAMDINSTINSGTWTFMYWKR